MDFTKQLKTVEGYKFVLYNKQANLYFLSDTVGIFAGRGDVILAMGMALILGVRIGWKLRAGMYGISQWRSKRKEKSDV